jgi:hypothetical protein
MKFPCVGIIEPFRKLLNRLVAEVRSANIDPVA